MNDRRRRQWNARPQPSRPPKPLPASLPKPLPSPTLSQRLARLRRHVDPAGESPEGDAWLLRVAAIACVPILAAYAVAGSVYGHLPLLTPAGFIDMPGACSWLMVVASALLVVALVDHLTGNDTRSSLRKVCLVGAAIATGSALACRGLLALGVSALASPGGLAPRAEWPLYPLQWTWPWLLPLARDRFVLGLIGVGVGLFVLAQLLSWRKVKRAWLPLLVLAPLLMTLTFLGSAAYDFAAARALGGLDDPDLAMALARDPGRHNVFTFLSLWIAIGFASVGLIFGFVLGRSDALSDS